MKAAKSGKMKSATPYETKIEVIVDELPMKKEGVVNKRRVPAELRPVSEKGTKKTFCKINSS